jgi:hypothetical protein
MAEEAFVIRFEGFGLNWRTALLVGLIIWTVTGGLLTRPLLLSNPSDRASAAVAPCQPYAWQYKFPARIIDTDVGGPGQGELWIDSAIKWNGCDVMLSGRQSPNPECAAHWVINQIVVTACSGKRINTDTAYGQRLIVRAHAHVTAWITPFGVTTYLCAHFDRNGRWTYYYAGITSPENCGWPPVTK